MDLTTNDFLHEQLLRRRTHLECAAKSSNRQAQIERLLKEVDAALVRMEQGSYGICEVCHDSIEKDRLLHDPLLCYCLDHLTAIQQRALERDLETAARIQRELLPKSRFALPGWEVYYTYEAAGPVGGDVCDVMAVPGGDLFFLVGDVSGKGVAASMLMAQLQAIMRTLVSLSLPLDQIVRQTNTLFSEGTTADFYATLVAGRASPSGSVELCNAGHTLPRLVQGDGISRLDSTGLPIGLFSSSEFAAHRLQLMPGESLVLFTDGLTEAGNVEGIEFGDDRLDHLLSVRKTLGPQELVTACLEELAVFRAGAARHDDLTVMAIQKLASDPPA